MGRDLIKMSSFDVSGFQDDYGFEDYKAGDWHEIKLSNFTDKPLLSRHKICETRDLLSSILHLTIIKALCHVKKPR